MTNQSHRIKDGATSGGCILYEKRELGIFLLKSKDVCKMDSNTKNFDTQSQYLKWNGMITRGDSGISPQIPEHVIFLFLFIDRVPVEKD